MDTDSGLRRIADRIANNAYWDGPHDVGGNLTWFARVPHEGGRQEVGNMVLTEDRLEVRDYGWFGLGSMTNRATGTYALTAGYLYRKDEPGGSVETVLVFEANDQITTWGGSTDLLLQLIAHGLLE